MIWLVGNGAGGIFQSSNSILFGWPGASLFYVVAGVWLALPTSNFPERFSRYTLRGLSVLVAVGAVLAVSAVARFLARRQHQRPDGHDDDHDRRSPSRTRLAWIVSTFGDFAGTIGGGFNVVVILWLVVVRRGTVARQ